jgi:hypothetical protein
MIKKFIYIVLFMIGFTNQIFAQTCGPNCPACSGSSDGSLIPVKSLSLQGMYIPNGEEENGIVNLRYGAFEWLDLGVGYTFKSEKFIWNARIQAFKQDVDTWKPGLIIGTGSIRTGSSDQSIYASLLKTIEISENFETSLSGGIATLTSDLEKIYGIGNVSLIFYEKVTVYANFDGISFHEGIAWSINDWLSTGVMLVESKDFAITAKITKALFKSE